MAKIRDLLNDNIKEQLRLAKQMRKKRKRRKRNKERLTESDIKHLMGMDRDIYERRNGAIRRK